LLCSGCGGTPLTRDQYKTKLNIEVVFVEDLLEVEMLTGYENLGELTYWGGDICFIFAVMPEYQEDDFNMSSLGHGFLHCVLGDFHK